KLSLGSHQRSKRVLCGGKIKMLNGPGSMGWRRIVLCLAIVIMSSVKAIGQLTTATVTGSVTDQTGSAIPGVTAPLKNLETGVARTTITNETGKYEALSLPAGNYEIRASLTGFQTAMGNGVSLGVGQTPVVNFALQVGALSESVTAEGQTLDV